MSFWPDGTPKSTGNAFDWRSAGSEIAQAKSFRQSQSATQQMAGKGSDKRRQFTIYSRAKAKA